MFTVPVEKKKLIFLFDADVRNPILRPTSPYLSLNRKGLCMIHMVYCSVYHSRNLKNGG